MMNLSVMTGDFMTGKTTWIMQTLDVAARSQAEFAIAGVVSPAVFENGKKTGIDALLLPGGERFPLARPCTGPFVDERAAHARRGREKLGWEFDAAAMERINRHLASPACASCDLLVIDELGPLELLRGEGYTKGLALLDAGAVPAALVVVRPALLGIARERWGAFERLTPQSDIGSFLGAL